MIFRSGPNEDILPVVDVNLVYLLKEINSSQYLPDQAPPSKPHPELLTEIGELDIWALCRAAGRGAILGSLSKGRESLAHANMDAMQDALVDNLSLARNKIGSIVGKMM